MIHLKFDMWTAHFKSEVHGHPQLIMEQLGITYQHATPQSINESWWFWNCDNIPEELPPYLKILDIDPMEAIGYGLSLEDAQKIINY